jgi:hypothetical protein
MPLPLRYPEAGSDASIQNHGFPPLWERETQEQENVSKPNLITLLRGFRSERIAVQAVIN